MARLSFVEIARRNRLLALKSRTERRLSALTAAIAGTPLPPSTAARGFGAVGRDAAQGPVQGLTGSQTCRLHQAQF